jgi:hypothetical protein
VLLPSGRRIDFVADRGRDNVYLEVKTVHPDINDTEEAWKRYEERRKRYPKQADFIAPKDWMGARVYGGASKHGWPKPKSQTGTRSAGVLRKRGPWHRSNLEDFADFYHAGKHRQDDPFALMEAHHIKDEKLQMLGNVDNFACLVRPMEQAAKTCFVWPVRGPSFGGVEK